MADEAKPSISLLKLSLNENLSSLMNSFPVYSNANNSIMIICNGKCNQHKCDRVGTQWAAVCAFQVISKLKPDLIINAGTCGGIDPKYIFSTEYESNPQSFKDWPSLKIADVFIGSQALYSDHRIPLPQWKSFAIGNYSLFGTQYLCKKLEMKSATVSSSNSFAFIDDEILIYKQYKVICKDMECAAIAEICSAFDCKLVVIKGVTDIIGFHDHSDFLSNFANTNNRVSEVLQQVIVLLLEHSILDIESFCEVKTNNKL